MDFQPLCRLVTVLCPWLHMFRQHVREAHPCCQVPSWSTSLEPASATSPQLQWVNSALSQIVDRCSDLRDDLSLFFRFSLKSLQELVIRVDH
eukprot:3179302-Amphidinium_carterae.1